MILLLDNYDSFTYNLYQYLGELGADVRVVRNDAISLAELARRGIRRFGYGGIVVERHGHRGILLGDGYPSDEGLGVRAAARGDGGCVVIRRP